MSLEYVAAGFHHQTLTLDLSSIPSPSSSSSSSFAFASSSALSQTLQLAWSVVLSSYTATQTIRFDLDLLYPDHAFSSSSSNDDRHRQRHQNTRRSVSIILDRNDTAQQAMSNISQQQQQNCLNHTPQAAQDETSNTLLAIIQTTKTTTAAATPPPSLDPTTYSAYSLVLECFVSQEQDPPKAPVTLLLRAVYRDSNSVSASTTTAWSSATVYFMLCQVRHAMRLIAASSSPASVSVSVASLRGISAEGQQQLLDWSAASDDTTTTTPLPPEQHPQPNMTVWSTIHQRCRSQPSHPAIDAWDGRVTYAELEQRVTAVSQALVGSGGGGGGGNDSSGLLSLRQKPPYTTGVFVGLLLQRSLASTILLLAVVRAGLAFVLLDASQPVRRLRAICTATGAGGVVAVIASPGKNMEVAAGLHLGVDVVVLSTDHFSTALSSSLASSSLKESSSSSSLPSLSSTSSQEQQQQYNDPAQPDTPLYAGFTSGSTGSPKGFVMRHTNFLSGLNEYYARVGLTRSSRAFLFASCSFVVSITGQLAPLCRGACLCLPSQRQLDHDLAGAIRDLDANWIAITPSAARTLDPSSFFFFPDAKRTAAGADGGKDVSSLSLQTMVMVGEQMTAADVARWRHLKLYSLYGQSENSKGTMIADKSATATQATAAAAASGTIGTPFYANAWIVDAQDHNILLPIGAEGELVIESPCLTEGYINNKHETDACFIQDPAWAREAAVVDSSRRQQQKQDSRSLRIFKTGDLARRNPTNGSFQLLGRKGAMIKIRGQRVEPGEVEHQIQQLLPETDVAVDIVCPCSASAVVSEEKGDKEDTQSSMLVAFILPGTAASRFRSSSVEEKDMVSSPPPPLLAKPTAAFQKQASLLSSQLRDVLPSFMIPTAYVELTAWPKTSTGKVHRLRLREAAGTLSLRALLRYSMAPTVEARRSKPPLSPQSETEMETLLRDLCATVLRLPRAAVGLDDTFIGLGGDSLMARHLITAARARGLEISLAELIQPVTLAKIAHKHQQRQHGPEPETQCQPESDAFSALGADFLGHLPASLRRENVQDILPTLELQAAYASNRVVDCFPLHICGPVDAERLHRACQALVARHSILRTIFHDFHGRLIQVVLRELDVTFSVVQQQEQEHGPSCWDAAVDWVAKFGVEEQKKRYDIGKPIIGFVLVSIVPAVEKMPRRRDQRHILIMRLSHGQYDALCLRPLIQDLWAAYRSDGQQLPLAVKTDFRSHVQDCLLLHRRRPASYDFWRRVLQNSSQPRPLFPVEMTASAAAATLSLTMRQLPSIRPLSGTTAASMVKTAWLEAVRCETGLEDVVFGQFLHVWSGRGEGVMGPCMNMVPVRVMATTSMTRRQIAGLVQAQHAEMTATTGAEALGWTDIVANCTDWRAGTGVDSVVLHQNFDRDIEVVVEDDDDDDDQDGDHDNDEGHDGRLICRKQMPILSEWAVFPLLLVTHPRQDRLDALLLMSSAYRGLRDAVGLLDRFADALALLQSDADGKMESEEGDGGGGLIS